ncbi:MULTISPECIES: methyl-accepting chemotaxis protein [Hydrocarboniphaga]|uniref:methyl-accepting chemotaxis protein n=1 Tax=Hydrocarboniphaga TaxID=243627 RepID=UPI002ABB4E41|nr:methyl-accepting chemotaxis protein [Hydrocarboniphaga sp.]MDZ4077919.1 methyl-accepting chemotaxis protein [Hydrocarboniphaga sp.]
MKKKSSAAAKASSKAKPKVASRAASQPKKKLASRPAARAKSRPGPVGGAKARAAGGGHAGKLAREVAELRAHIVAIRRLRAYAELSMIGEIVDLNDNFAQLMGYARADLLGRNITSFMEAGWQRSEARGFWEQLSRGESVAGRYLLQVGGGREICMQANFNPVVESGALLHIAVYATDVTDQARQMAEYAGQLQAIGRSQAVIHFTLDGHILEANDNFLTTTGYRLDEIVGQHHAMFVDPVERSSAGYKAFWDKLGRGEYDAGQYRRVAKGGRELWLQASYNAILDSSGRPIKVVKYASDITAQVQASHALTAAVEQTQAVVMAAGEGDLSRRIPLDGKDGMIRSLCDGVNTMLDGIESATHRERVQAAENLRIRMALDNVNTNVMIANKDREIIYVNKSIEQMLLVAEADLRKQLPQFDARRLLGANIDVFHRHPEHQRHALDNLRDTLRSQIKVGGRTFTLTVNPIVGEAGERLGTVVEWADRTVEVSIESEIGGIVQAAANGDFSRRVTLDGKEGFFRQLAESMNHLLETSSSGLDEVARVLGALAHGDLTQTISGDYQGTFGKLRDDANQTVEQLTQIVSQIKTATDTINVAAREIANGNNDLSARTEQQAASLEETASSMEELTSTVKQNAENAKQANQLAMGASEVARRGGSVVSEVVTTMNAINESSKKIVDIISVIDGIAFQTNILALNAAVEAARAGEQGRGFAVVAAEVRSLAQRSAAAAKEIKGLIGDSVEKVGNGSKLVEQAGRTMDEIVTSVKRVTDIMSEISAASQEQSQGIEQVNQTITQMDEVTQQNAALVEEASAAARSLEEQASGLAESVSQFRLEEGAAAAAKPQPRVVASSAPPRPAARPPVGKPAAAKPAPGRSNGVHSLNGKSNGKAHPIAGSGAEQWTEF